MTKSHVLNFYNLICPNPYKCSMFDDKKNILFFKDRDHLTFEGSEYLTTYFDEWIIDNLTFNE